MRPIEQVYREIVWEIYLDFFKKKLKASDSIKHLRHITANFPLMSPSRVFANSIKINE